MKSSDVKTAPAQTIRNLRFQRNEQQIIEALCVKINERCNNIQVRELCRRARVTAPTFYLHYRNSNDARTNYENQIIANIDRRISKRAKSDLVFTILISYIIKNQTYFLATTSSHDHYLLVQVLYKYRTNLVGNRLSDRSFLGYVGKLITTITLWLKFDKINAQTAQRCIKDLLKVRP